MRRFFNLLDKRVIKYLLLFFLVSFIISSVSAIFGKIEGIAFSSYNWLELGMNLIVRYVFKFVFIFTAIILVRYLYQNNFITKWVRLFLHFIFAIVLTFYSVFIQVLASNLLLGTNDEVSWNYIYGSAILGTDYNFFLYFCAIAIVYAYYSFKREKDLVIKENHLKTQLLDSKMSALQSQLQPHFLFNTLNDISTLIDISPEKSQNAIADLSDLLRKTLSLNNTKYILISEEIALLKKYLEIEKIRFQDKLSFSCSASEALLLKRMPPLLLQPIVENSIKHGFSYEHDSIAILVEIIEEKNYITFYISNNGQAINNENLVYGTGLQNVITRLSTLYGTNFEFEMVNTNEHKVQTILKIPNKEY